MNEKRIILKKLFGGHILIRVAKSIGRIHAALRSKVSFFDNLMVQRNLALWAFKAKSNVLDH